MDIVGSSEITLKTALKLMEGIGIVLPETVHFVDREGRDTAQVGNLRVTADNNPDVLVMRSMEYLTAALATRDLGAERKKRETLIMEDRRNAITNEYFEVSLYKELPPSMQRLVRDMIEVMDGTPE